jgi:hypothetical protein
LADPASGSLIGDRLPHIQPNSREIAYHGRSFNSTFALRRMVLDNAGNGAWLFFESLSLVYTT